MSRTAEHLPATLLVGVVGFGTCMSVVTRPTFRVTGSKKLYVSESQAYKVFARKLVFEAFRKQYGSDYLPDPMKEEYRPVPRYLVAWSLLYSEPNTGDPDGPHYGSPRWFHTQTWRKDQGAIADAIRLQDGEKVNCLISEILARPIADGWMLQSGSENQEPPNATNPDASSPDNKEGVA